MAFDTPARTVSDDAAAAVDPSMTQCAAVSTWLASTIAPLQSPVLPEARWITNALHGASRTSTECPPMTPSADGVVASTPTSARRARRRMGRDQSAMSLAPAERATGVQYDASGGHLRQREDQRAMPGKLVHFELPARDVERAKGFWSGVFGWEFNAPMGMDYWMTQNAEGQGGAVYPSDGTQLLAYFDTDDIDATLEQGARAAAARPARSCRSRTSAGSPTAPTPRATRSASFQSDESVTGDA